MGSRGTFFLKLYIREISTRKLNRVVVQVQHFISHTPNYKCQRLDDIISLPNVTS
jgi:hypothetical protein